MLLDNTLTNNYVGVVGKVHSEFKFSHEIYGEGFYTFHLETERLSSAIDILPITISERLIEKDTLSIGTLVQIQGQIRSYNNYVEEEKRNKLVLTIFVREIEVLYENEPDVSPNEIFFNGYICKNPIYRKTPFNREICDLLIAVNRSYNKSDYIPCISWGRNARFCSKLIIGDNVKILGRMQSRNYQKKLDDGTSIEKIAYEISINKIEITNNELKEMQDTQE